MIYKYLGEFQVELDMAHTVEQQMFFGEWDPSGANVMRKVVRPGDYVLDVGANVGPFTLLLAQLVGIDGHVTAIEPGPPFVERLRANIERNPHIKDRVTILDFALGNKEETQYWAICLENSGNGFVSEFPRDNDCQVQVIPLDKLEIDWLDFIKIDVEGMELDVLRGARNTLNKFHPIIWYESLLEFGGMYQLNRIASFLMNLGYVLYGVEGDDFIEITKMTLLPRNTLAVYGGL